MLLRHTLLAAVALAAPSALAQDLSITASAEDSAGDAGGRVQLMYTVTLTGAEEIEDVPVGFYFSTDQTLSSDDVFSEREEIDVESDEPESDDEQIDIPSTLPDGDYFILVVIDDLEQVSETDETNNVAAVPFRIGMPTATDDRPDAGVVLTPPAPNPLQDQTTIQYALAEGGAVRLAIYDALGRQVAVLVDGPQPRGPHDVVWNPAALASGAYVVVLEAGGEAATQRVTVVR